MHKSCFYAFFLAIGCLLFFSAPINAQVSQMTDGQKRFFIFNACMKLKKNENICLCEAKTIQKEFSQAEWEQYYKLNSAQNKSESGLTPAQIDTITSKVNKVTSDCWTKKPRCKRRCPYNGRCLEYF